MGAFCGFSQSLAEVEVCGCGDWWYTATLAFKAKAKTRMHAASSRSRQQVGLKGLSGSVSGGMSTTNYTWKPQFRKRFANNALLKKGLLSATITCFVKWTNDLNRSYVRHLWTLKQWG